MRDANLIVIASEDTHAVSQYFGNFSPRRVAIEVLPTIDGRSSPAALLQRIDDWRSSTEHQDDDEFWLCFDKDHWANAGHIQTLSEVLQQCSTKGYGIAVSNPCFELWILLHFDDSEIPNDTSSADVADKLKKIFGGYNKAKCCGSIKFTLEAVNKAITSAKTMDKGGIIQENPMSHMYLILRDLLDKKAITIKLT